METINSKDGTKLAFDKCGTGGALILVWGTLFTRKSYDAPLLPPLLENNFTVYNYDRRGRGDSRAIRLDNIEREREIEDIEALIDAAGGSAYLFGHSSGAALSLYAAANLQSKVKKLVIYEPPFSDDTQAQQVWNLYTKKVNEAVVNGSAEDAVTLTMRQIGMSTEQIDAMRDTTMWDEFLANAPSLAYDPAVVLGKDRTVPIDVLTRLTMPVLIMVGGKSSLATHELARKLTRSIPHGKLYELNGQSHEVKMEPLAPVLIDYFEDQSHP